MSDDDVDTSTSSDGGDGIPWTHEYQQDAGSRRLPERREARRPDGITSAHDHEESTGAVASERSDHPGLEPSGRRHERRDGISVGEIQARYVAFGGPIPPPVLLKGYGEIDPSFPERIMAMAERSLEADIRQHDRLVQTDARGVMHGLWITGGVSFVGVLSALVLGLEDVPYWWAALGATGLAIAPKLVGALRRKSSADDDD